MVTPRPVDGPAGTVTEQDVLPISPDILETDEEERRDDALRGDFIFEPEPEEIQPEEPEPLDTAGAIAFAARDAGRENLCAAGELADLRLVLGTRLDVQESAIMRFVGALIGHAVGELLHVFADVLCKGFFLKFIGHTPHPQRHLRHHEMVLYFSDDGSG